MDSLDVSLIDVTCVSPLQGHMLALEFSDGSRGTFDMTPYLGIGQFVALQDEGFFQKVRVEAYTAAWPGGIDIAPELLYSQCERETAA